VSDGIKAFDARVRDGTRDSVAELLRCMRVPPSPAATPPTLTLTQSRVYFFGKKLWTAEDNVGTAASGGTFRPWGEQKGFEDSCERCPRERSVRLQSGSR
jgi:hypothetical protein